MIWADPQVLIGYNIELYPHHNMVDNRMKEKIAGINTVWVASIHEDWPW